MPDQASARKPPRFLGIVWGGAILLVILWIAAWFYGRARIDNALDEARKPEGSGYVLDWSAKRVGGFPFRFVVVLENPRFSEPSGWGASATRLEFQSAAYNPAHLVGVAEDGLVIVRPGKGAAKIDGEVLRASVSDITGRPRVSVEGRGLTFAAEGEGVAPAFSAAEAFELHLRPEAGDRARLFFQLTNATPAAGSTLSGLADQRANLRLEAEVSRESELRGPNWAAMIQRWGAAGGQISLVKGEASVGEAALTAGPTVLGVGPGGRLQGRLPLALRHGPTAILALGAAGALPPDTAAVAAGLAGAGGTEVEATLTFQNGQTMLGPLPIGRAPGLY